jgi:hypothetical protein
MDTHQFDRVTMQVLTRRLLINILLKSVVRTLAGTTGNNPQVPQMLLSEHVNVTHTAFERMWWTPLLERRRNMGNHLRGLAITCKQQSSFWINPMHHRMTFKVIRVKGDSNLR